MELTEIRKILDSLDEILIKTLAERMEYIHDVARYKMDNGLPRYQPEREEEIIKKRRVQAKRCGLDPDFAEEVMKTVIKYAHKIEKGSMGR